MINLVLTNQVIRQLLKKLQQILIVLDNRPAVMLQGEKIHLPPLIFQSFILKEGKPLFVKVKHLGQLSPFIHGIIHGVCWGPLLLLFGLQHLPGLLCHHLHLGENKIIEVQERKVCCADAQVAGCMLIEINIWRYTLAKFLVYGSACLLALNLHLMRLCLLYF